MCPFAQYHITTLHYTHHLTIFNYQFSTTHHNYHAASSLQKYPCPCAHVTKLFFSLLAHAARKHRPPLLRAQLDAAQGLGPHLALALQSLSDFDLKCIRKTYSVCVKSGSYGFGLSRQMLHDIVAWLCQMASYVPSVICHLAVVASYEPGFRTLDCFVTASMFVFCERTLFHCQIECDMPCFKHAPGSEIGREHYGDSLDREDIEDDWYRKTACEACGHRRGGAR